MRWNRSCASIDYCRNFLHHPPEVQDMFVKWKHVHVIGQGCLTVRSYSLVQHECCHDFFVYNNSTKVQGRFSPIWNMNYGFLGSSVFRLIALSYHHKTCVDYRRTSQILISLIMSYFISNVYVRLELHELQRMHYNIKVKDCVCQS